MPRPSLKDERSVEILDAFTRCIARFGLDGSTLARISEEAGVGRPLLRHYLGNRDQMVEQVLSHVIERFAHSTEELFGALPETGRLDVLVSYLFDGENHSSDDAAVFQALVAAADRYDGIRHALLGFVMDFEARIATEIAAAQDVDEIEARVAGAGVASIYFNTQAVAPLSPSQEWRDQQRLAALRVLHSR